MAVHDLRLGLDLELAQLVTQSRNCCLEFRNVEVKSSDLLIQSRVVDADFAGCVEQVFEQIRVDARELLALLGGA